MILSGKVAVVTGGGRGIGAATARRLSSLGAAVGIVARTESELRRVAGGIEALGGRALAVAGDVSKASDVRRSFRVIGKRLGPIDILVNNAGVVARAPCHRTADAVWDTVLGVNLRGAFLCAREVIPGMIRRGRGRIVQVSSVAAVDPLDGFAAYASSKAGLLGLTRALAVELRAKGVGVFAVLPGSVDTRLLRQIGGMRPKMPPADAASVIGFLASDAPLAMSGSCVEVFG